MKRSSRYSHCKHDIDRPKKEIALNMWVSSKELREIVISMDQRLSFQVAQLVESKNIERELNSETAIEIQLPQQSER